MFFFLLVRNNGTENLTRLERYVFRYYILGFNFNEKVRVNRDSCQLPLERIGVTNWAMGKTKVRKDTLISELSPQGIY